LGEAGSTIGIRPELDLVGKVRRLTLMFGCRWRLA
jgi:hypothetical protein